MGTPPSRFRTRPAGHSFAPLALVALVALAALPLGACGSSPSPATDAAPSPVDAAPDTLPAWRPPVFPEVHVNALLGNRPKLHAGDPSRVVLGSTGRRMFALDLRQRPGIVGDVNYIHEEGYAGSNLGTRLLELSLRRGGDLAAFEPTGHLYWPDHTEVKWKLKDDASVTMTEQKFITEDDCVVDELSLTNGGATAAAFALRVEGALLSRGEAGEGQLHGQATFFGVPAAFAGGGTGLTPVDAAYTAPVSRNADAFGYPKPSASYTFWGDSIWEIVDGDLSQASRWTAYGSENAEDWLVLDLGAEHELDQVVIHYYDDSAIGGKIRPPASAQLALRGASGDWQTPADLAMTPAAPAPGKNEYTFTKQPARYLRLTVRHQAGFSSGVTELEALPEVSRTRRALAGELSIPAGETQRVNLALCLGPDAAATRTRLAQVVAPAARPLDEHAARYEKWFQDHAPRFFAPDPFFERMWVYRWFVARFNLAEIGAGRLKHPAFFEGRQYYSRVIQFSTPHILDETRWLRDSRFAYGHLQNLVDNQYQGKDGRFDGQFPYLFTDRRSDFWFINWIAQAAWGLYQVHPRADFRTAFAPALERNVRGTAKHHDADGDYLYKLGAEDIAFYATGMEYQPAFYWFAGDMNLAHEKYPDIERADFTSYLYGNARAMQEMAATFQNKASETEFKTLADRTREAVLKKMWRKEDTFFYDLLAATDEPALVKQIVGFFPFAFGVPPRDDPSYLALFDHLTNPKEFWTPYPVATISQDSSFFSQVVPGGCCHWNGPTWPFSNSLVLEALARAAKEHRGGEKLRRVFWELLKAFTLEMFENRELDKPEVSESMNGQSGTWKSTVVNYFHSKYNDLLIRHVGGLTPRADEKLELHPIPSDWAHFAFQGLRYHGKTLDILWDAPDGKDHYADGLEGFAVYVDGKLLFRHPKLAHVIFDPAGGKVTEVP